MGNYITDWLESIDAEGSEDYGEGVPTVYEPDNQEDYDDHDVEYE